MHSALSGPQRSGTCAGPPSTSTPLTPPSSRSGMLGIRWRGGRDGVATCAAATGGSTYVGWSCLRTRFLPLRQPAKKGVELSL
eukprot:CAMPEP_0181256078 /NCGR_PEP_ID=MMETSP1096-20121128/49512_1 /TAXON_ID=156174 ORGANISM="Chrysochromulina ericina, Strain CCMP281" /NCGR_SAMPLE_ID=MMETSP1096 /ASSEMBLY_ACC=CAM_ASM_000453 /LENGTH=82 /DNA_ID=CAMNT_0023354291 /DNA_START=210 /DNA_END=458 /DNA_ORIENTATION=+